MSILSNLLAKFPRDTAVVPDAGASAHSAPNYLLPSLDPIPYNMVNGTTGLLAVQSSMPRTTVLPVVIENIIGSRGFDWTPKSVYTQTFNKLLGAQQLVIPDLYNGPISVNPTSGMLGPSYN